MHSDDTDRGQTPLAGVRAQRMTTHAGGGLVCDRPDGPPPGAAAACGAVATPGSPPVEPPGGLSELRVWTDGLWASLPERWAVPTAQLCPCQRLLLGLVVFGRLRYQQAAARTGLPRHMVSALCTTALQHLNATSRDAEGQVGS